MAPALVTPAGPISRLLADKAYDTNPLRALLADKAIEPVIPSIRRRKPLIPYDVRTRAQSDRAYVLPPQGLPPGRHPIRQARPKLLGYRHPRRHRNLVAQLSPDPSLADQLLPSELAYGARPNIVSSGQPSDHGEPHAK